MTPPLHGLLLAGGKSTRMGRDKASLVVGGEGVTQAQRAAALLRKYCARTFVSLRAGQPQPPGSEGMTMLRDSTQAQGPLSGILAAFAEDPDAAWLVIACDLPFVTDAVLAALVERHRASDTSAFLAYASSSDGLPEPLCAIYGPSAGPLLARHASHGRFCPRHIMIDEHATLLPLPAGASEALANINTPEDLEEATSRMIHVSWFGKLSERRGLREEWVPAHEMPVGHFLEELKRRHLLEIDSSSLRIAVNDEFADAQHLLRGGDKVAFMPPFCGG